MNIEKSSFRDPSGYLFYDKNILYRNIMNVYREHYDLLMTSGLYINLVKDNLLIKHNEIDLAIDDAVVYKTIQPEIVDFISYPYEWCFSQLKDAALLTLEIQKRALAHGMILKDASAYNVQFYKSAPIFIDTLSFEKYEENLPWIAYRQFCQHFLAPLCLMAYTDIRLNQLLRVYIDGIPLDLAAKLLPAKTKINFGSLMHIHMHAKSQQKYADKQVGTKSYIMRLNSLKAFIESLISFTEKIRLKAVNTEWGNYYGHTNYDEISFNRKKDLVTDYLQKCRPSQYIWDLGANTGVFSKVAADLGNRVISMDIDPIAVEKNYLSCKHDHDEQITPLLLDLTNPSPSIGWNNEERPSLTLRGELPDTIMALALIHHLAISNNVPLDKIAYFFSRLCKNLIIEFVPKEDSQVQKLLSTRKDIFPLYTKANFEKEFGKFFNIAECHNIESSYRFLYLLNNTFLPT